MSKYKLQRHGFWTWTLTRAESQSQYALQQLFRCRVAGVACAYLSHECRDYGQGWACLSLAVFAWQKGWVRDSVTYKEDLMRDEGESISHSSHLLPPLTGQHRSRLPYISHNSKSQQADVLPATLHGCLALHLPTTVHRPTALLWSIV